MSRDRAEAIWRAAATVNATPPPPADLTPTEAVAAVVAGWNTTVTEQQPLAVVLTCRGDWGGVA